MRTYSTIRRAVAVVALLAVIYASSGVAIHLNDVAQNWCGNDSVSWVGSGVYALFWPLRLFYGDAVCGGSE